MNLNGYGKDQCVVRDVDKKQVDKITENLKNHPYKHLYYYRRQKV